MQILRGHKSGRVVWGLAFSPDGMQLASSSLDDTTRLWDLSTGTNRILTTGFTSSTLSFSPSGDRLLCSSSRFTYLLDLAGGQPPRKIYESLGYGHLEAIFDPDGMVVVPAGLTLRRLNPETGVELATMGVLTSGRPCLTLSKDGRTIATAQRVDRPVGSRGLRFYDYPVCLWEYPSARGLATLNDATADISSLAFSPDGRWLAAASCATLLVWEVPSGRVVLRDRPDKHHFQSVAFSPDGRWLGAAHNDNCIRLYSTLTWLAEHTFDWGIGSLVKVCFASDGMRAAAAGKRGRIVVWDMDL